MKEKTEQEKKIEADHMKLIISELRMFGAPIPEPVERKDEEEVHDQYTANTMGAK